MKILKTNNTNMIRNKITSVCFMFQSLHSNRPQNVYLFKGKRSTCHCNEGKCDEAFSMVKNLNLKLNWIPLVVALCLCISLVYYFLAELFCYLTGNILGVEVSCRQHADDVQMTCK